MKKIIITSLFILYFSFGLAFGEGENNLNTLNGEFNIYNSKRPNIYGYKSIKLNENGELVYEYDKKYYEELLKVYGGQGILFFDKNSNYKVSLNLKIEEKNDSIYITFLKENVKSIYEYCKKTIKFNWVEGDLFSGVELDFVSYFTHCSNLLNSDLGLYSIYNSDSNNAEQFMNIKIEILKSLYDYKKLGEIYQNANKNAINTGWYSENNFNSFSDNIIKFNTYDTPEDFELVRSLNYLKDKYNNFYKLNENSGGFFTFDIEKDKEILNKFITDSLYYSVIGWNITNIGNLYLNKNNELYYIGEKREYTDHNYFTINYDYLHLSGNYYNLHLSCSNRDNICNVFSDTKNGNFPVSFKDFINVNSNTIYFNISKILQLAQKNNFIKNIDLSKLTSININLDKFDFPIVEQTENFLNITSKIASPKDINTNPFMIGFNFLLALLYLITFYFTAQFFNSYFEKIATKYNINSKISSLTIFLLKYPFKKINLFLKTIITKINFQKGKTFFEKSDNFFSKNEHRIYVILGLLLLGIIGQITVDDFDVLSLKGLLTIFLMIFILGLITFFKDFVLYFLNKGKEKEKIKIENIPLGFILATIVASTGRIVGLEPNMLFGNVLRINTKNTKAEKHLLSSNLLFKVLVITFIVGLIFWLLTLLFSPSSFFYKFFIIAYFGIVNDVFFALLPFGLLWGTFILKNKKMKWKWLIFTFIVFCFLIHTILNPEGDLEKILNFSGNILILVGFLSFWIIITFITYFYIKKDERKITQ